MKRCLYQFPMPQIDSSSSSPCFAQMPMRLSIVLSIGVAVSAAGPYQPKPETIAFLEAVMTQEEKEMFQAWSVAPEVPSQAEIQLMLLEALHESFKMPRETIHSRILAAYPTCLESVESLDRKKFAVLEAVAKPDWLHSALLSWPGAISDSSLLLLAYLETVRPASARGRYTTRAGLMRAAVEWNAMCISRLRAWHLAPVGHPPCDIHRVNRDTDSFTMALLSPTLIRQHIADQLKQVRSHLQIL